MAGNLVNQLDYSQTTSSGTISSSGSGGPNNTLALTAGNVAIGYLFNQSATCTLTDNLGNSYTLQASIESSTGSEYLHFFTCPITASGLATFTASSMSANSGIFIRQYSGLTSATPLFATGNYQNGPTPGTDCIIAPPSAQSISTVPALLIGAVYVSVATEAPSTGTVQTFTNGANAWEVANGTVGALGVEDFLVSSSGSYQITFGLGNYKQCYSMASAFQTTGNLPLVNDAFAYTLEPATLAAGGALSLAASSLAFVTSLSPGPTFFNAGWADLFGNVWVHGATWSGELNGQWQVPAPTFPPGATQYPPIGFMGLVFQQPNPATSNGEYYYNPTFNTSSLTGFTPANPNGHSQLGVAATGTTSTGIAENGVFAAYMQASDYAATSTLVQFTAQYNFPLNTPLFANADDVVTLSIQLQFPTAVNAPYIHLNLGFVGPGSTYFEFIYSILIATIGTPISPGVSHTAGVGSENAFELILPIGDATTDTYMTTVTGAYTGSTWTGWQTYTVTITQAQFQAALTYMSTRALTPNPFTGNTNPALYMADQTHLNAELNTTLTTTVMGWSAQDYTVSQGPNTVTVTSGSSFAANNLAFNLNLQPNVLNYNAANYELLAAPLGYFFNLYPDVAGNQLTISPLAWLYSIQPTLAPATPVPYVLGITEAQAETVLAQYDFNNIQIDLAYDVVNPPGVVFAQSPAAGTPWLPSSIVTLVVSQGPFVPLTQQTIPGTKVTTRAFSLEEMVSREWGSSFRAPDHRIYEFTNGRGFDSTDMGTTGIYSKGIENAALPLPPGSIMLPNGDIQLPNGQIIVPGAPPAGGN